MTEGFSPVGQGKVRLDLRRRPERLGGVLESKIMQVFDASQEVYLGFG